MLIKKIKEILDINKFSLLLISSPYLLFNFPRILQSQFFTLHKLIFTITLIIIADIVIKVILKRFSLKTGMIFSLITIYLIVFILYGIYITIFIQNNLIKFFSISLRGREITLFVFSTSIPFLVFKPKSLKLLNVFLMAFCIIIFFNTTFLHEKSNQIFYSNYTYFNSGKRNNKKPILLIITDEYASPDELYKLKKDSTIFSYSKYLENKNWIVKNNFYSNETSTIHSLSSLFNFNLSKDSTYKNQNISYIAKNKLLKCALKDSLDIKNINVINFGIFDFGKSKYLTRLYLYPTNFVEELFYNTSYYTIKVNTNSFEFTDFKRSYYPIESHNKYLFNNLPDSIKKIKTDKNFLYVHFWMPHAPFQYFDKFKIKTLDTNNYISYWNFTNTKLEKLLNSLLIQNKCRIILTGDHGFRGDKKINPQSTFAAFYGFDKADVDQIKSVQDLGSLINHYF